MEKLSQRDKRILIGGAFIMVFLFFVNYAIIPTWAHWNNVKAQIANQKKILEEIGLSGSDQAQRQQRRLARTVPAFTMPQREDQQRQLFAEKFYEQTQKARIKLTNPPQYQAQVKVHPDKTLGLNILRLKCRGTCSFEQAMNLLAALYENPYLYTIEEMLLTCGDRNREQMDLTLVVSTLCKM